ncbi:MAG: hypothetical protein AAGD38_04860 [Acidobacteriota bacterium]
MYGRYKAKLYPSGFEDGGSWRTNRLLERDDTPGDVGICLSGGGSRALCQAMGQVRALAHLKANNKSLLSQTKAMASSSGGSWLSVPFTYLGNNTSDDAFLNGFVADPSRLVASKTAGHTAEETLDHLPEGNICRGVTEHFSLPELALKALWLHLDGTPADLLWQTLMERHFLTPYGLGAPGHDHPISLFSWDRATLERDVTGPNPELDAVDAHLVASGADRHTRPFLICMASMFVEQPGETFESLVPVHSTPFFTGIAGRPSGVDANGRPVGGGGVTSFAFNSQLARAQGTDVEVVQERQWSLADITGTSSAAFASTLENLLASWHSSQLIQIHQQHADEHQSWRKQNLRDPEQASAKLEQARNDGLLGNLITDLKDLVPKYRHWSVLDPRPAHTALTRFADSGNLENTTVAAMLAFRDIRRIIAFLSSGTPIGRTDRGVLDRDGKEILGTRILIHQMLAALFGYQPHQEGIGYKLYEGDPNPKRPQGRNSRVFPSDRFADALHGLWNAHRQGKGAVFLQRNLPVLTNPWFGVQGDRNVDVLWVYPSDVPAWNAELNLDVRALLDKEQDKHGLPNISVDQTQLTPTQINLLAHLSAWMVDVNRELFLSMYAD